MTLRYGKSIFAQKGSEGWKRIDEAAYFKGAGISSHIVERLRRDRLDGFGRPRRPKAMCQPNLVGRQPRCPVEAPLGGVIAHERARRGADQAVAEITPERKATQHAA